jgi:small-conductance mechanosensitive channel
MDKALPLRIKKAKTEMAKKTKWYQILLEAMILLVLVSIKVLPVHNVSIPNILVGKEYISILTTFFIFLLSLRLLIRLLRWWYRRRNNMPAEKDDNVIYGLSNLYILLVVLFSGLTILALMGIEYKELFTTLSIVAAAIAIIFKEYISEIISGFLISFSRQINNDDYVKIGDHKGKIIDINLTKTTLINEDDDIIILPNAKVFSSEIINYTQREIKKINTEFEIGLDALESVEVLEEELKATLKNYGKYIQTDSYNLKIVQIKKDFLQMKFQYVLHKVDRELERTIRRIVARKVVMITKRGNKQPEQENREAKTQD